MIKNIGSSAKPRSNTIRIGGITPSVLRELSGLYQPFERALKELIVNSLDAGATEVKLKFSDDFMSAEVLDNGSGMTPYEFKFNFLHIGRNLSEIGKQLNTEHKNSQFRVGGKGIGFLAPARYCNKMKIQTRAIRANRISKTIIKPGRTVDLYNLFSESIIPLEGFLKYGKIVSVTTVDQHELVENIDFYIEGIYLILNRDEEHIVITFNLDSSRFILKAEMDFKYLLDGEVEKSLEQVDDFCSLSVSEVPADEMAFTSVTLLDIKEFVQDLLKQPSKRGNVRNIASKSGFDQFIWNLTQAIPVKYDVPCDNFPPEICSFFDTGNKLSKVTVLYKNQESELFKKVFIPKEKLDQSNIDVWVPINIVKDDFQAKGYIIGQSEVIYPSEMRGISIKVKNVEVGSRGFLGFEYSLTGARKAALNQITGEINILSGVDPNLEINPGRDGFYKESRGYQIMRDHLVGNEEQLGGIVNKIVQAVINRSQMHASVEGMLARAKKLREGMIDISKALNNFVIKKPEIIDVFEEPRINLTLADTEIVEIGAEQMLTSYRVIRDNGLSQDYKIDYVNRIVTVNGSRDIWKRTISVWGEDFEVVFKKSRRTNKLCEIDTENRRFLINWDHPTRALMDDKHFIKNAVGWAIASSVSPGDPDEMINTALYLTTFNS